MHGYCECGCGKKTRIAPINTKARGWIKGEPIRFFPGHNCRGTRREKSHHWKGGRFTNDHGYSFIYMPDHPRAYSYGYVLEHILKAETIIGKGLPKKAVIHHHTKDQLVVCENQSYHVLLHQRTRAFNECGVASWLKCKFCKKYDDIKNLYKYPTLNVGFHRECFNNYRKERRKRNGQ